MSTTLSQAINPYITNNVLTIDTINADFVTTLSLSANSVTVSTLSASTINVATLSATHLTASTITTNTIITTSSLQSFTNVSCDSASFETLTLTNPLASLSLQTLTVSSLSVGTLSVGTLAASTSITVNGLLTVSGVATVDTISSTNASIGTLSVVNARVLQSLQVDTSTTRVATAETVVCNDVKSTFINSQQGNIDNLTTENIYLKTTSGDSITFNGDILQQLLDELVPVGSIQTTVSATITGNWLVCNGASVSKTTYSKLYAVIGATYGETSTHFNLPNFQGCFLRGVLSTNATPPIAGYTTEPIGTYVQDSLRSHSHTITTRSTTDVVNVDSTNSSGNNVTASADINVVVTTDSSGGSETAPVHTCVNYLIRF